MKNTSFFCLTLLFLLTGCAKRYYIASDFSTRTIGHQTIAVLPVEMVFTGNQPKDLTEEDIAAIEEGESKAFMISLYDAILRSTKNGKKPMRVSVQSYTTTISMLEENNITIRESWSKRPAELAQILGVDAVVQSRIHKNRYMSDLASYGISVGVQVVQVLSQGTLGVFLPGSLNKTNDIKSNFTLVSGEDGAVLYSRAFTEEADWNRPSEQIIDRTTVRFAKFFPYRIGKN